MSKKPMLPTSKPRKHIRRKRKMKKVLVIVSLSLVAVLVGVGSYAGYTYWSIQEKLKAQSLKIETKPVIRDENGNAIPEFQGAFNMLVVGSDERDSATPDDTTQTLLNDVNLLIHVNEDHKRISVVSFPRDLMVEMPECDGKQTYGDVQINTALRTGGLNCVVKTVESITGLSIPYATLVNFQSVVSITNEIGGVPVCLATPIRDEVNGGNIFEAGDINLDGNQALMFVRMRHGVGNGSDLGRINNQQVFIKNAINKVVQQGVLSDPIQTVNVANILLDNTKVSESLADINTLLSVAKVVREVGIQNIDFYTIPYTGYTPDRNRVALNVPAATELINSITAPTTEPTVEVETVDVPSKVKDTTVKSKLLTIISTPPVVVKLDLPPLEGSTEFAEQNAAGVYCGQGSGY